MSVAQLTAKQQLLLWDLLARGGSALQKNIKIKVGPKDRNALEKPGYVTTAKQTNRSILLTLTDRAWHDLSETEPRLYKDDEARVSADRRVLQFVLVSLSRYARAKQITLDKIFLAEPDAKAAEKVDQEGSREKAVEQQIKDAFFAIAGQPAHDNVRLSALRKQLKHIDRKDLDAALIVMRETGRANLLNLDNPRDIESEGDAALKSGIHTFHLLWIDG